MIIKGNPSVSNNLDIEKVVKLVEDLALERMDRELTQAEKIVLEESWKGRDYKEIASQYGYNPYYLQQKVGPQLWTLLSQLIGNGTKVKKTSLKINLTTLIEENRQEEPELLKISNENKVVEKPKFYGIIPKIEHFYGREREISYFKNQIQIFNHKCLFITGMAGIGKTSFTVKLVEEALADSHELYEYVIWKEVSSCRSIDEVIVEVLKILGIPTDGKSFDDKLIALLKQLAVHKYLIILDGLDNIVDSKNLQTKVENGKFFTQITQDCHQSCTIVTSQIPIEQMTYVNSTLIYLPIKLEGLDTSSARKMLENQGLVGEECNDLINQYRGNPADLEIIVKRINKFFGGNVKKFFSYKTTIMSEKIQLMLNQQFDMAQSPLNDIQRQTLIYLAENIHEDNKRIYFSQIVDGLKKRLGVKLSISELMDSMQILEQRSLVETQGELAKEEISYGLSPVIRKYILVDPLGLVYKSSKKITMKQQLQE